MKKIAIISASGSGRKRTLPALKNSEIAQVTAIHGRDKQKIEELGTEWEVNSFTDLEELSAADFDILYIASPPFLHKEQIAALEHLGKPIICEKPLCITESDTDYFKTTLGANSNFMLAHHLRHQKAVRRIKNIVDSNTLGSVRSASFQWNFPLNKTAPSATWKLNPQLGGNNPFFDAGIHAIDMAILLFGKPHSVFSSAFMGPEEGMYETVSSLMRFDNFNISLNASSKQTIIGNDLVIHFENGTIRSPQAFTEKSMSKLVISSETGETIETFKPENLYKNEVENFCQFLDGNNTEYFGTNIDDALLGMKILHAISSSFIKGTLEEI